MAGHSRVRNRKTKASPRFAKAGQGRAQYGTEQYGTELNKASARFAKAWQGTVRPS
jgi:hypothetical protein